MTEKNVEYDIKTPKAPAVLEPFKRAKSIGWPEAVREGYRQEELRYENLSGHIAKERAEGKAEGEAIGEARERAKANAEKRAIAMALRDQGLEVNIIESITGLSAKEIFDKSEV